MVEITILAHHEAVLENGAGSIHIIVNPDLDWHRHRAASKRRVRVRFEAHLFVPGFLSVGNYNTTLSSDSLETGTDSSNSLCSANESLRTDA